MSNGVVVTRRSGASFAQGVPIDGFLEDKDRTALYSKWKNIWGEPLAYRGGETSITCELILQAPVADFAKAMGSKSADRILQIAQRNAVV